MKRNWLTIAQLLRDNSELSGKLSNVTAADFKAAAKNGGTMPLKLCSTDDSFDDTDITLTNVKAEDGGYTGTYKGVMFTCKYSGNKYLFTAETTEEFTALNPLPTLRQLLKELNEVTGEVDNTNLEEWQDAVGQSVPADKYVGDIALKANGITWENRTIIGVEQGADEKTFTGIDKKTGAAITVVFDENENATFTVIAPETYANNFAEELAEGPLAGKVVLGEVTRETLGSENRVEVELQNGNGGSYGTLELNYIEKKDDDTFTAQVYDENGLDADVVITFDVDGNATFTATAYNEQTLSVALQVNNGTVTGTADDLSLSDLTDAAENTDEDARNIETTLYDLRGNEYGYGNITKIAKGGNDTTFTGIDTGTGALLTFTANGDDVAFTATLTAASAAPVAKAEEVTED